MGFTWPHIRNAILSTGLTATVILMISQKLAAFKKLILATTVLLIDRVLDQQTVVCCNHVYVYLYVLYSTPAGFRDCITLNSPYKYLAYCYL